MHDAIPSLHVRVSVALTSSPVTTVFQVDERPLAARSHGGSAPRNVAEDSFDGIGSLEGLSSELLSAEVYKSLVRVRLREEPHDSLGLVFRPFRNRRPE